MKNVIAISIFMIVILACDISSKSNLIDKNIIPSKIESGEIYCESGGFAKLKQKDKFQWWVNTYDCKLSSSDLATFKVIIRKKQSQRIPKIYPNGIIEFSVSGSCEVIFSPIMKILKTKKNVDDMNLIQKKFADIAGKHKFCTP